jgi:hypothetical protein
MTLNDLPKSLISTAKYLQFMIDYHDLVITRADNGLVECDSPFCITQAKRLDELGYLAVVSDV